MAGIIDAVKLGWRSFGDDAIRAATVREAVQKAKVDRVIESAAKSNMSAQKLAENYPKIQADATNFLNDFHAAYKQPSFDSLPENLAYSASRKLGGIAGGANQMVQGLGGIPGVALQAAFIAPMFMSGMGQQEQPQQPELQPYEQEALARAQIREMRRQQMAQYQGQQQ